MTTFVRGGMPVFVAVAVLALAGGILVLRRPTKPDDRSATPGQGVPSLSAASGSFGSGRLDPQRWEVTSEGDFEEKLVDIVHGKRFESPEWRLRLRAATRGTRDDTVKFLGVRSVPQIQFGDETRISADIDWNNQANGCYLSSGIILAPESTGGNPLNTANWLKVEYVGVPPGRNGRLAVFLRSRGSDEWLFSEGWPQENRGGRPLSLQSLQIVVRGGRFEIRENGVLLYDSKEKRLPFSAAHLYLQMSSHSNYPAREVFFDNISLTTK